VKFFWSLVALLLQVFFFVLIARLVFDYVQMFARSWRPTGVVLVLAEVIYTVTDPPLKALRRVIPPLRLGAVSLDLSFLVLIIVVQILAVVASRLAASGS
jgi:YggT family protein